MMYYTTCSLYYVDTMMYYGMKVRKQYAVHRGCSYYAEDVAVRS
jgi:hypothetical protein